MTMLCGAASGAAVCLQHTRLKKQQQLPTATSVSGGSTREPQRLAQPLALCELHRSIIAPLWHSAELYAVFVTPLALNFRMSATMFKNAVRRREHYERSQPAARSKYGLLEKHGDYVARAQNFHAKEKRIAALRAKAENRNKDEFYFAMAKGSTKKGVHSLGRGDKNGLTVDKLLEFKAQDLAYLHTKKSSEDKKIERLQASLHAIAATAPRSPGARARVPRASPRRGQ